MTLFAPSPDDTDGLTALQSFLQTILPGIAIVQGQANLVAEPTVTEFVVMTPIHRKRLATNIESTADCRFIGSIAGTAMTVTDVTLGAVFVGAPVFGPGVAAGTTVIAGPSGGGAGVYTVAPSQTVGSGTLSASAEQVLQETQVTVQLDVHSADLATAGDMAQTISTLLRSDFGATTFAASNPGVVPLYSEDPRQMPFLNAEQQYETRWVVEAVLQMQQVLSIPQQYADSVKLTVIDVEAAYGP